MVFGEEGSQLPWDLGIPRERLGICDGQKVGSATFPFHVFLSIPSLLESFLGEFWEAPGFLPGLY